MIAQVRFTPNEPRTKNGTRYIDIKVDLVNGEQENVYAKENTDDWDALMQLEQGQIIEVEQVEGNNGEYLRLTDAELDRVLSGNQHIANYTAVDDPFEVAELLNNLYEFVDDDLEGRSLAKDPTEETVRKIAITAFLNTLGDR